MKLKRSPELHSFLSTYFSDIEPEGDEKAVQAFISASSVESREHLISQLKAFSIDTELSIEELGTEANRWFSDSEEARVWLRAILNALERAQGPSVVAVKDCNGTPLSEGDSVQVIKDLKVKGGSSDLKRGTLIKKIHLIGDPDNIECRVDGSTLVLKTCFLKKA